MALTGPAHLQLEFQHHLHVSISPITKNASGKPLLARRTFVLTGASDNRTATARTDIRVVSLH
jgi:hypothetical protein